MNYRLNKITFTIIIFCFLQNINAQHFFIKNYSTENGLPSSIVNDACQDSDGYMWFATYNGISKYDGFNFTNYDTKSGLTNKGYRKLRCDEKGILWAVPYYNNGSIVYFKDGKWSKYTSLINRNINYEITSFDLIYKNDKPVICIGTYGGLDIFENNKWNHHNLSEDTNKNIVNSLIVNNGYFYISTKAGLCIYHDNNMDWDLNKKINPSNSEILAVNFEDFTIADYRLKSNKKIWVLSNKWLGCLQNNNLKITAADIDLPALSLSNFPYLDIDRNGYIFFGNNLSKYLYINKIKTASLLSTKNGFSSKGGTSLFIDREYNVWLTDTRGIDKISNTSLINYFESDGMPENEVTAITEMDDGRFVIGYNNQLAIFENYKFKNIEFPTAQNNLTRVLDILKDKDGNIWFTANNLGVGKLQKNNKIKWYQINKTNFATALYQDKSGKIWIGSNNKLFYLKNDRIVEFEHNDKIINTIRNIYAAPGDGFYITGVNGLFNIKGDKIRKIPSIDPNNSDNVNSYYKTKSGIEFVGTMNGLYFIENGKITKYNKNGININTPIYFIFQDNRENYWLGSNNGVYYWDGKSKLEIYNKHNGLAGRETNRSAGIVDSKGNIWIGTDEGLSCFTNSFYKYKTQAPKIMLLYIEDSKGIKHQLNKTNIINNTVNTLTFHFRGLSFYNEDLIGFTNFLMEKGINY